MPHPARYEDIEALPEHLMGEIIHGELVVSPRPRLPHVRAASRLGAILEGPFDEGIDGPGGWTILDEPELRLEGINTPIIPDLAGWRAERMAEVPDEPSSSLAPDWVCEVLSPRTGAVDRTDKMEVYAAAGVAYAWLVDPLLQTLESYRLEAGHWVLLKAWRAEAKVRAEPFQAIEFDLQRLWRRVTTHG